MILILLPKPDSSCFFVFLAVVVLDDIWNIVAHVAAQHKNELEQWASDSRHHIHHRSSFLIIVTMWCGDETIFENGRGFLHIVFQVHRVYALQTGEKWLIVTCCNHQKYPQKNYSVLLETTRAPLGAVAHVTTLGNVLSGAVSHTNCNQLMIANGMMVDYAYTIRSTHIIWKLSQDGGQDHIITCPTVPKCSAQTCGIPTAPASLHLDLVPSALQTWLRWGQWTWPLHIIRFDVWLVSPFAVSILLDIQPH